MELNVLSIIDRIPDEGSAYKFLEDLRWGDDGPVCPHCGSTAKHYFLTPKNGNSRATRTGSPSQRRVWKCKDCRRQFTVLVGTIFHGTKISVRTWVLVIFEMVSSKNGVSAREVERKYGLTAKSAWFLTQRIREAMKRGPMVDLMQGEMVVDEAWIGGKPKLRAGTLEKQSGKKTKSTKQPIVSIINKTTGEVRSRVVPNVTSETLYDAIVADVMPKGSTLHTDEAQAYGLIGESFDSHERVWHSGGEYVRGTVSTNQAEQFFSQLKRSIDGTHHHVSREHLHRYLAEFDFRHSTRKMNDTMRMGRLLGQVGGRRLTYRPTAAG